MATRVRTATREKEIDTLGSFLEEYGQGIAIDKDGLDENIMHQADLFYKVSETLALTISRRDEAKDNLKIVEAEVEDVVRQDAAEEEKKVTEAAIRNQVILHRDVRDATQLLAKLNREVGQLQALKEGYTQRSYMLKELVSLYLTRYYGDNPSQGRKANEAATRNAQYDDNRKALNDERRRVRDRDK
jgi:hypothetical protein